MVHEDLTRLFVESGAVLGCSECFQRSGANNSSQVIVGAARLVDSHLRVDRPPGRHTLAFQDWLLSGIESRMPGLIADWADENLPELFRRAGEVVAVDWLDQHAELLNYWNGPAAYEWASKKLWRKGFVLSLEQQYDLTEGLVQSGELLRAVSSFDLRKGGGKESSWLATVFYRYALHELRTRYHPTISIDDEQGRALTHRRDDRWRLSAPGPAVDVALADNELSRLLAVSLKELSPRDLELLACYFGLGTHEHTLAELAVSLGVTPYRARMELLRVLETLGVRLGAVRNPTLRERTNRARQPRNRGSGHLGGSRPGQPAPLATLEP